MTGNHHDEPIHPGEGEATQKKVAPRNLAEFLEGYIGVMDSSKDPNAGTYKTSASAAGQQYSDLLWEEYQRDQAEAKLRYERERNRQQ